MSVVARAVPLVVKDDVLDGLRHEPKALPPRLLFERSEERAAQIDGLDDYYPARCELRLLDAHLPAIAREVGVAARVLEPAPGGGIRTKRLLAALDHPAVYAALACPATVPTRRPFGRTLVFVPGGLIDRYEPHEAVDALADLLRLAGPNARLLLTADGSTDRTALERAYDDQDGVVAAFNMRALARVNATRDATFDLAAFRHRAVWNVRASRVELQLVSQRAQEVVVGGERFALGVQEPLITQHVYKHSLHAMRGLLGAAGWTPTQVFTAHEQPVRLWLCAPRGV